MNSDFMVPSSLSQRNPYYEYILGKEEMIQNKTHVFTVHRATSRLLLTTTGHGVVCDGGVAGEEDTLSALLSKGKQGPGNPNALLCLQDSYVLWPVFLHHKSVSAPQEKENGQRTYPGLLRLPHVLMKLLDSQCHSLG